MIKVFKKTKYGILKLTFDLDGFNLYQSRYWYVKQDTRTYYLYADYQVNKKTTMKSFHRVYLNLTDKTKIVDHMNNDGLDNTLANLRIVTQRQNQYNQQIQINPKKTSKYKGVSLNKSTGKWVAKIKYNCEYHHLGTFIKEEDAAKAYNSKAIEFFGEYAKLNII